MPAGSTKKEKTIGENIVVMTMLAIFMAFFLHYFFKQSEQMADASAHHLENLKTIISQSDEVLIAHA